MQSTELSVRFSFCIFVSVLLFFVPVQLVFSWLFAAFVHEVFHYIALRFFRLKVYKITIDFTGAFMQTEPMGCREEIVCSLAGPIGGLVLFVFANSLPYVAIFGFVQSVYNLLPVYPLDGGRALRAVAVHYLKNRSEMVCRVVKWIVMIAIALIVVFVFRAWQILILLGLLQIIRRKV